MASPQRSHWPAGERTNQPLDTALDDRDEEEVGGEAANRTPERGTPEDLLGANAPVQRRREAPSAATGWWPFTCRATIQLGAWPQPYGRNEEQTFSTSDGLWGTVRLMSFLTDRSSVLHWWSIVSASHTPRVPPPMLESIQ